jgi:hypothetical protein
MDLSVKIPCSVVSGHQHSGKHVVSICNIQCVQLNAQPAHTVLINYMNCAVLFYTGTAPYSVWCRHCMVTSSATCSAVICPLTLIKTVCRSQFETTQVVTQKYKTWIFINPLLTELMCGGCCRKLEFKQHPNSALYDFSSVPDGRVLSWWCTALPYSWRSKKTVSQVGDL